MVIVEFFGKYWDCILYIYIGDFYISSLTTVQPLCYRIFFKSEVVILIEN